MTYDPLKMIEFQQTGSLAVFRESSDMVDTFIFSNSPQSNFLSLSHEFGIEDNTGGEGEGSTPGAMLVLEFVDPRGLFDSNVDFSPTTMIDTSTDLVAQALKRKRDEALGIFNQSYAVLSKTMPLLPKAGFSELVANSLDLDWLQESIDQLQAEIEDLETVNQGGGAFDADDEQGETQALKAANKQVWAHNNQLKRPVWITYGIGDNLADWCPPMVFNKAWKMEFAFNATAGRVMKLKYAGVGQYPTLTPMGIMPLETIGLGAVMNGTSRRLFNGQGQLELQNEYPNATGAPQRDRTGRVRRGSKSNHTEIDAMDVIQPSLHKIITDTLKDFLEIATNAYKPNKVSNVVVLFPDLDPLLRGYFNAEYEAVKASNSEAGAFKAYANDEEELTGDQLWHIEATCETLEGLGFSISVSKNDYKGRIGDSIFNEIESQVDNISNYNWLSFRSESNPGAMGLFIGNTPYRAGTISPESVIGWMGDRDIRCEMQTDGLMKTVGDAVDDVANKIKDRVMEYSQAKDADDETKAITALQITRYIETDFNTLQILHKHGLIEDPSQPALIFGDEPMIKQIIDGELYETAYALKTKEQKEMGWDPAIDDAVQYAMSFDRQVGDDGVFVAGSINPFDIEDGWTSDLVKEMYDLRMPIPWLGPFGPTGNLSQGMENFLPDDVNLNSESWDALKEAQPDYVSRVPVFSFGTKNPNILEFTYDINDQYMSLMDTFNFINMSSFQRTNAILGGGTKEAEEACNLLSLINEFQSVDFKGPKKDGIPLAFVALIQPFWDRLQAGSGGSAVGSADWEKIFNSVVGNSLFDDLSGREFERHDKYVEFMWKAFCSLTNSDYRRWQVKQSGVNNVGGALTRWINASNQLSNMAVTATIKTTPMFHLANRKRVVNRQSLLLGMEPRFAGIDKSVIVPTPTWFSGLYELMGFKHEISATAVHSSFLLVKPTNTGGFLNRGH